MLIINKQTIIAGADPRNLPCNYCAQLSILNIQHYLGHGIARFVSLTEGSNIQYISCIH